ncbi:hypothetical protein BTJ39_07895 [Izhakiella australiensis]|uniref:Uncharacterized protein n=1 Tax=Izhakiella australiensis TaxID=1926881 RepID=A0A1S8YMG4_9GAMM|nr:hypothetical protein [Izhakiella australiensis]OON40331.1 hypothetical protein BTJ39_07895 [Izhakiella australiensis]
MKNITTALLLLAAMAAGSQAATVKTNQVDHLPRKSQAVFTPAAARCDSSACQTNCYVENSRCNAREGGGCSANLVSCTQACNTQCR